MSGTIIGCLYSPKYLAYCYYPQVDSDYSFMLQFRQGEVYSLPESLPGVRVLREGGNGLILEATVHVRTTNNCH